MCCLKGVAVVSLSLIFRFTEFCSVPCHPRDMKQQDFILLEIRGLSRNSWRRMRKGLSVLAWKLFTSHLNLRLNYIEPDKDVRVYSGSKPRKLVNLFCLHFFRNYAVNFISWRVNFQMVSDRWILWCKGFPFSWLLHFWLLALMSVAWWMWILRVNFQWSWMSVVCGNLSYCRTLEIGGVGCDFFSCSIEKYLCSILLFWMWVWLLSFSAVTGTPYLSDKSQSHRPALSGPSNTTCLVPCPGIGWALLSHPYLNLVFFLVVCFLLEPCIQAQKSGRCYW